ncbi:MAG: DUF1599 domain-containing protein [Saprospiraceae bacterium]|nr:DUF1599 domain-containing protein [Saprospiraceae bacterium]MDP4997567.1 DUF1599 domain-containing protein [Saprospiraceae bacterium]
MERTSGQFDLVIQKCRELFSRKTTDYGTAWRILRPTSLTDQLLIKAKRIRSVQEKGIQMIEDSVNSEFIGLVNYSLLALIQRQLPPEMPLELPLPQVLEWYDREVATTKALMLKKNHDYGEIWRDMRVSSMTDLVLMKLLRIKQIEDNGEQTQVSEGIDANYRDIINYAIFALIKIEEENTLP